MMAQVWDADTSTTREVVGWIWHPHFGLSAVCRTDAGTAYVVPASNLRLLPFAELQSEQAAATVQSHEQDGS